MSNTESLASSSDPLSNANPINDAQIPNPPSAGGNPHHLPIPSSPLRQDPPIFLHGTAPARPRSRSYGNQPLGWSPKRVGPLSPNVAGRKPTLIGLTDIHINATASFPGEPPIITESQRAMEAAVQKERQRVKDMEKEEESLTAEQLRTVLKRERHRMARMAADLASMRSMAVKSVADAEMCEEGRINNLMRRLECLQQEKGRIIVELEREEEMLTNNLQKKLNEVRREKALLEKRQMSRTELEARLAALKRGAGGDADMSEALEEKEEMEQEED